MLPEEERRETLVSYSDNAKKQEPRAGEKFDLEDMRKDEECADTVGVYLHVDGRESSHSNDARSGSADAHPGYDFDSLQRPGWRNAAGNSRPAERFRYADRRR